MDGELRYPSGSVTGTDSGSVLQLAQRVQGPNVQHTLDLQSDVDPPAEELQRGRQPLVRHDVAATRAAVTSGAATLDLGTGALRRIGRHVGVQAEPCIGT